MAYPTEKVFTWTADNIIERALRIIGEYDEGDAPTTTEVTQAAIALNSMVREWAATDGVGLWLRRRCILILNPGQWRYKLGGTDGVDPTTANNWHAFYDTELLENTIDADEAIGQTVISIEDDDWVDYAGNSAAKCSASDYIGIEQDDGTIHWSDVAGVGADTVTISDALTVAASAGNRVFTYTNRIPRPHGILTISRESNSKSNATIDLVGRRDYEAQSQKGATGVPTQAHFDPQLDTHAAPAATLHVWPVSNDTSWWKLTFVGEFHPAQTDTDGTIADTENIEFPDEWASALAWNLANEIADEYEIALPRIQRIAAMARTKYDNLAWAADREEASFIMSMDRDGR